MEDGDDEVSSLLLSLLPEVWRTVVMRRYHYYYHYYRSVCRSELTYQTAKADVDGVPGGVEDGGDEDGVQQVHAVRDAAQRDKGVPRQQPVHKPCTVTRLAILRKLIT